MTHIIMKYQGQDITKSRQNTTAGQIFCVFQVELSVLQVCSMANYPVSDNPILTLLDWMP